jgi:hypothetical protein
MAKCRMLLAGALLLGTLAAPAAAQMVVLSCPPACPGFGYVVPGQPYAGYGYPAYAYYPYPLPPAPSLGFGRGGLYGHVFVPRDNVITGFTLPGALQER